MMHTVCFTAVEPDQDADDTCHHKKQTYEVELTDVVAERLPLVRVEVQEKEEYCPCDCRKQ